MSTLCYALSEILNTVCRTGNFYATGTANLFTPRIEVEGFGPISLPLMPAQAESLIMIAERAPYGRGEDTLVDTNIRCTWQIHPDRVRIVGKKWQETIQNIVTQVAADLGVVDAVEAEFYKLLIYDVGSFFLPHRDTEKSPGMFATLVMVLPSIYTGGELIIRHNEREVQLDLSRSDLAEMAFAAFYADCLHEVLPVTTGCRLTLIYNLVNKGVTQTIEPPQYDIEQTDVTALLQHWVAARPGSLEEESVTLVDSDTDSDSANSEDYKLPPEKIVYLLEHAYTPAELSFMTLKGQDAASAPVLVNAAAAADCEIYLALATIEESGSAEHIYYSSRSRHRWSHYGEDEDEANFEVGEVYDHTETLSDWCSPDGSRPEIGVLPFQEDELCPPDAFKDMNPSEQHFLEATGNEGASFDRTYRLAALVLWPQKRTLAVLSQGGLTATIPYLSQLVDRWEATAANHESLLWHQAHALSGYMVQQWQNYHQRYHKAENAIKILAILERLGDAARIDDFVERVFAKGGYDGSEKDMLVRATKLLPSQRIAELLERIVITNAPNKPKICSDLLAQYSMTPGEAIDLLPAITALVAILPGDQAHAVTGTFNRRVNIEFDVISDLLLTCNRMGAAVLAERIVDHILINHNTFSIDKVIIQVALRLHETSVTRDLATTLRLRKVALDHLQQRLATSLTPPSNWTRIHKLSCNCRYCIELDRFLVDPETKMWNFKFPVHDRNHIASTIHNSKCDVDCITLRTRPSHTLQCTKNQASHDRRVQDAQRDIALLDRLARTN